MEASMKIWKWLKSLFKKKIVYPTRPIYVNNLEVELGVKVNQLRGFDEQERMFFLQSLELTKTVVTSLEFKIRFLNLPQHQMNGYTITSLYNKLMSGHDAYEKIKDYEIDYSVAFYSTKRSVIGKTIMGTAKTFINRIHYTRWMKEFYGPASLAGHTFHEYLHVMGLYHHSPVQESIVYYAGYLMKQMCKEVMDGRQLTPINHKEK